MRGRMGFAATVVTAVIALAISSCGAGDGGSALDDALGVIPADTPLALVVSTDLESEQYQDLDVALQRFGVEGGVEGSLEGIAGGEDGGFAFGSQIEPLLGNELVIGIPENAIAGELEEGEGRFIAAIRTSDGDQARELLEEVGLQEDGEAEGFTIYGPTPPEGVPEDAEVEAGGPAVGLDGDLLVAAESRSGLEGALAGDGDTLSADAFEERLGDLPTEGLIRAVGDVPTAIEAFGIEQVASVPWIESLRSYGLVATVDGRTATIDAALSGDEVSDEELPLLPGPESPQVVRGAATFATLDQSRTLEFALDVAKAAAPAAALDAVVKRIETKLNGSVSGLAGQFGEGLSADIELGQGKGRASVTRSEVKDPAAVSAALKALGDEVPRLARLASSSPASDVVDLVRILIPALPVPEDAGLYSTTPKLEPVSGAPDLYRLTAPGPAIEFPPGVKPPPGVDQASREFVFGLVNGVFVTGPSLEAVRQAASAQLIPHQGPPGSVAANLPLRPSDLELPAPPAGDVVVTTAELGLESSSTRLRLRIEAGL